MEENLNSHLFSENGDIDVDSLFHSNVEEPIVRIAENPGDFDENLPTLLDSVRESMAVFRTVSMRAHEENEEIRRLLSAFDIPPDKSILEMLTEFSKRYDKILMASADLRADIESTKNSLKLLEQAVKYHVDVLNHFKFTDSAEDIDPADENAITKCNEIVIQMDQAIRRRLQITRIFQYLLLGAFVILVHHFR